MNKAKLISLLLILFLFLLTAIWKISGEFEQHDLQEREDRSMQRLFWNYHNQASNFLNSAQYDSAAYYYEKALAINSEHEGVLYYLGSSRLFLREYDEARVHWSKLAEINPLSVRARLQLGNLYFCMTPDNRQFDPEHALVFFHEAHLLNREDTGPQLKMAKIALLQNQLATADEHLNVVMSVNHLSYQAQFLRAYLKWVHKDRTTATEILSAAAELYQNLTTTVVHGEGETSRGARAMLAEDRFCDLFEIEIGNTLRKIRLDQINPDLLFTQFQQSLNHWKDL